MLTLGMVEALGTEVERPRFGRTPWGLDCHRYCNGAARQRSSRSLALGQRQLFSGTPSRSKFGALMLVGHRPAADPQGIKPYPRPLSRRRPGPSDPLLVRSRDGPRLSAGEAFQLSAVTNRCFFLGTAKRARAVTAIIRPNIAAEFRHTFCNSNPLMPSEPLSKVLRCCTRHLAGCCPRLRCDTQGFFCEVSGN
jgi:hypothetical protein